MQSIEPSPNEEIWQEHWFEHSQLVKKKYEDEEVAVFFDDDMIFEEAGWIFDFYSEITRYLKANYGDPRGKLYGIFHRMKYFGGHPSYYYSDTHDNRNVIDIGANNWADVPDSSVRDMILHETAHIVESTVHGKSNSPAFGLWHDSKWSEFFEYDFWESTGRREKAYQKYNQFMDKVDNFPRVGTQWFMNWFYPLWRDYGRSEVMRSFFSLIERYWPERRDMNYGEYVHFMSAAARVDLKGLAINAFSWTQERENQFIVAHREFPELI